MTIGKCFTNSNTRRPHPMGSLLILLVSLVGLSACGGGSSDTVPSLPAGVVTTPPIDSDALGVVFTVPYKSTGAYADSLRQCTYRGVSTEECTLNELPFIGQEFTSPTIEDVLDRTLVSHPWMGDNFRTLLEMLPTDLLELFRSVTAVVIASDVRPAYYDSFTGAIYLDPDFLWLTLAEASNVDQTPDFRSEFGNSLSFDMYWRYVRNNQSFVLNINDDGSRDVQELRVVLGFLLYHELAHAVDFMHPSRMPGLDSSNTAKSYLASGVGYLSNDFDTQHGNQNDVMKGLARVSFFGETPTPAQAAYTAQQLAFEFPFDRAIQYYSYSNQFEDFANTFETVMMSYHFGYEKDIALMDTTAPDFVPIVAWGQRGRLGDMLLTNKALAAVQAVGTSNQVGLENHISGLPLPLAMVTGISWQANLTATGGSLAPVVGFSAAVDAAAEVLKNVATGAQISSSATATNSGTSGQVDDIFARVRIQ